MQGKLKIWMQLLLTIGLSLVVVWAGVIVWQGYVSRSSALQQAEAFSLSMHEAAMAGLTGMMVTGTIDRREVLLDQMNQLGTIRDVRVVRGPALVATFGAGTPLDPKADADEQWVLDNAQTLIKVERDERGEYLRAIRPTLALSNYLGKNCLTCHQVPERSVLGAVSMKVSLDRANEELVSQRWKSVLVALLTSIPVLALIYPFIRRVVTRPLETGVQVAHDISRGDLRHNVEVTSGNEIGGLQLALQGMTDSLRRMVQQVRNGVDSIYNATSEIASGNQDLSSRTEQQAATLDRVASSMQELTSAVNQNADHARQADRLATAASEVAARGGAVVANVVDTMQSIQASSQRVADIIAVIDNIAFQTNILALNAAVEAARAGEQGRGFAVVASEVRALAQRSASAAREIKTLIDDSVQKVSEGSALVHQAGATMNDIVTSIGQVTDIIGNIAAASAEQTQGIGRLDEAVADINGVTQQNAALVEQAAAAAQSLKEQAAQLERVMDTFKT